MQNTRAVTYEDLEIIGKAMLSHPNPVNLVNLENNPVKRVFLYIIANNYTGAVSSKGHKYGDVMHQFQTIKNLRFRDIIICKNPLSMF